MEGYVDILDTLDSRQFMIAVKRLADSLSYGTDSSPFLGSGVEYVQSRPYQFGDPVKSIDWRVTARTNKLYVKEYEAPKRMPCYILFDTSASMTVTSTKRSKYELAMHIGGGLAFACLDRVSPVGVIGVGGRDLRIQPSLSKDQVMQWMMKLRRYRFDEPTSLGRRIQELSPTLKDRALVIVLSDLHDESALKALKRFNQLHDCVVIQLRDPAELRTKGTGFFRGREAESGRRFVGHGGHTWVDQEVIDQELKRGGLDHLIIDTDQTFVHKLRSFFEQRGLTRGAR